MLMARHLLPFAWLIVETTASQRIRVDVDGFGDLRQENSKPEQELEPLERFGHLLATAAEKFKDKDAKAVYEQIKQNSGRLFDILKEHKDVINKVLEEVVQDEDFKTAEKKGELITADELAMVDDLEIAPEFAATGIDAVEHDMVPEDEEQKELLLQSSKEGRKWLPRKHPNHGRIAACIHESASQDAEIGFKSALVEIQNLSSCISFVDEIKKVSSDPKIPAGKPGGADKAGCDIMLTGHAKGCWAGVGARMWPPTPVHLGDGCHHHGIAVHEILHALGVLHEHSRPDRDKYIDVKWDNIADWGAFAWNKGDKDQFAASKDTDVQYDIQSIMHYCKLSTSGNGKDVYEATQFAIENHPGAFTPGQRYAMTPQDVEQLELFYCREPPTPRPTPRPVPRARLPSIPKFVTKKSTEGCPNGYKMIVNDGETCRAAAKSLGRIFNGMGNRPRPGGCYIDFKKGKVGMNTNPNPVNKAKQKNICQRA